jgi:hypothetical protein
MYGIEVVEVCSMSVQERAMIRYGDGSWLFTVVGYLLCCIILVSKWCGFQLLGIAYDTYFVSLEVTFVFQNTSLQVVQHDM